jgi:hypothetical protein
MAFKTFLVRTRDGCLEVEFEDIASELEISASVGVDGVNRSDDVRTIQQALNQVPASAGGPVPPLVVDGICGDKTDRAISTFQLRQVGFSDGRVDPENVTIAKLRQFSNGQTSGPAVPAARAGEDPPTKKAVKVSAAPCDDLSNQSDVMNLIYGDAVPNALKWILKAQIALDQARDLLLLPNVVRRFTILPPDRGLKLVNKFFHLNKVPKAQAIAEIGRIHLLFTTMRVALGHNSQSPAKDAGRSTGPLQRDPCCINNKDPRIRNAFAYSFFGGFTRKNPKTGKPRLSKEDNYQGPNLREDTIFFCTAALGQVPESQKLDFFTETLLHEMAHWVGPEVNSPRRITDFAGSVDDANFFKLSPARALRNAESYAQFAAEATLGHVVHDPTGGDG